jgi:hypothetical protein
MRPAAAAHCNAHGAAPDACPLRCPGLFIPDTGVVVAQGRFFDFLPRAPQADLNLFGLVPDPDFDFGRRMVHETHATCLFIRDSGHESALA